MIEGDVNAKKREEHKPTTYKGPFENNVRHGKLGIYNDENGSRYVGDFENDKFSGRGTFTWPDNSSYEGEFLNDMKHGKGTYRDN